MSPSLLYTDELFDDMIIIIYNHLYIRPAVFEAVTSYISGAYNSKTDFFTEVIQSFLRKKEGKTEFFTGQNRVFYDFRRFRVFYDLDPENARKTPSYTAENIKQSFLRKTQNRVFYDFCF